MVKSVNSMSYDSLILMKMHTKSQFTVWKQALNAEHSRITNKLHGIIGPAQTVSSNRG